MGRPGSPSNIVLELKGRIPSKKNSKQIITKNGRPLLIPSKNHELWHETQSYLINKFKPRQPIDFCKLIKISFFMPDNRKTDLTNKAESIMDLLVDNQFIKDDNWKVCPELNLISLGVDKENPRAEIIIEY